MIDGILQQMVPGVIDKRISDSIELLRNDVPRRYRIDIETDSTIFADAMQERQDATEFITAVTGFITNAETLGQSTPELVPVLGKMLQFGVRKFRTGRDLESAFDTLVKQLEAKAKKLKNNPPVDPETQKQHMEMQKAQLEMQAQAANDQRDAQRQMMEFQGKQQIEQMKAQIMQQKTASEQKKMQMQMQLEAMKAQLEERKMSMELQSEQAKQQLDQQKMAMDVHAKGVEHQQNMAMSKEQHTMDMQASKEQHKHSMQAEQEKHKSTIAMTKEKHKQGMVKAKSSNVGSKKAHK